jgi:hypothetical protein
MNALDSVEVPLWLVETLIHLKAPIYIGRVHSGQGGDRYCAALTREDAERWCRVTAHNIEIKTGVY